jgi:hypothetical protein
VKLLLSLMILLASISGAASAQTSKSSTLVDLVKYSSGDRERVLYEGAKKEGKVVWYTSLVPSKDISKIFETKYPASDTSESA